MNTEKLRKLYRKYNLGDGDYYKHKHYVIITRQGVQKIEQIENIRVEFELHTCTPEFAAIKVYAKIEGKEYQTFASAKYGERYQDEKTKKWKETGSTNSWYVLEIAEKRARSRAVLSLVGLYEEGVFGEDESEEFISSNKQVSDNADKALKVAAGETKDKK